MNVFTTLHTNGLGYWSRKATAVDITKLDLQYCNYERDFGELCVHFATDELGCNCWDTAVDGLIYTDKQFMTELRAYLQTIGFTEAEANDVSYSEQGMQTDEYVSCDVGAAFLEGLERLDESHVYTIWKECLDV
jgi:hypothetical protein